MIIIWNGRGRLGNQLFQLAYIEKFIIERNEKNSIIMFVGNSYINLNKILDINNAIKVNYLFCVFDKISYYLRPYVRNLFDHLAKLNVISSLRQLDQKYTKGVGLSSIVEFKKGFIDWVVFADGYFQFSELINSSLKIKNEKLIDEKNKIDEANILKREKKNCAINFRFTDYKTLEQIGEKDFVLPVSYFVSAIMLLLKNKVVDEFYAFTDDECMAKLYVSKIESKLKIKIRVIGNQIDHMVAMSLCDYLILSPSTYGWWAWKFNSKEGNICIVPKYWLGYKSGFEYPPNIIHNTMWQINVIDIEQ